MPKPYKYQETVIKDMLGGKHLAILKTGMGKSPCAMLWLAQKAKDTQKVNALVVTTASKSRSGDFEHEADVWNGDWWRESMASFEVISWHKLRAWTDAHKHELRKYLYVFDEVAKAKGYTSGMGKAFREICAATPDWTGYTATPGDKWIDLMPYMVATGLFRNKTDFMRRHCVVQNYKGFPEITHYLDEEKLQEDWRSITTIPDTREAENELPKETHKVIEFERPGNYSRVVKTRTKPDGTLIESAPELCHCLRQLCFTKEKQEWLRDFIENLGDNCVFFCNYIEEEETLAEIAKKALPKGAKVWRIDGSHHEIPAVNTIGPRDIVIAHYLSGGEALNLQFMRYWCAVSPNYSLSTSVQARGRIKRLGQTRPMFFYYLKTTNSIEADIYKCLKAKKDFSAKTWVSELET